MHQSKVSHLRGTGICIVLVTAGLLAGRVPAQQPAGDLRAYRLQYTQAETIGPQLREFLSDANLAADVLVDQSANQLLIRGGATEQRMAAQLVETLDRQPAVHVAQRPDESPTSVRGYPVAADMLDEILRRVREEYAGHGGVRIAPDPRTSQIIVVAPPNLQREISEWMRDAGVQASAPRRVPEVDEPPVAPALQQPQVYQLRNITWRELEDSMRRMLGANLSITAERDGELATLQLNGDEWRELSFQVDRRNNRLLLDGPPATVQPWLRIATALDRARPGPEEILQPVALRKADPVQVQQAIHHLRSAATSARAGDVLRTARMAAGSQPRWGGDLVSMIFQEDAAGQPGVQPPPGDGALADTNQGGMIGDVQIEFIPEYGLLIIRGSEQDVARVQAIIDEIEAISALTRPVIQVVPLAHANSVAMGALLEEVYTEVYEPRQGPLSITALVKPNSILLIGRQENIDTIVELIGELDRPVDPSTQVEVFQLRYLSATDAQAYLETLYGTTDPAADAEATAVAGLATRVSVVADFRTNSLIVQASPRDMLEIRRWLEELDVDRTAPTMEVRIFPLTNALATELQAVLQNAFGTDGQGGTAPQVPGQPGGAAAGGQTAGGNTASSSVQIVGIDQDEDAIIESGILADVSITADANLNALIVRAPSSSMELIAELIRQLDRIPAVESQIKVFQIENGDATNLTAMLQTLFGQQVTAGQVGVFSQTIGQTFGVQGLLTQQTAGETSLIPLRLTPDPRTNSIVASGSAGDLAVVEAILIRLDLGDIRQRRVQVYRLNNAPSDFVATALQQILAAEQQLLTQQQGQQFSTLSQFEVIDSQIFVVSEPISNTLIVSAVPELYQQISEVIADLDRRPPLVKIDVVIAQVNLSEAEELGVELGIQDSLLFDRGSTVMGMLSPGFNFVGQPLPNATEAARELLGGQAFSSFNTGRSSAAAGFPGLVLSASNESVSILIRALAASQRLQVLSRPTITTLNNVPASVLVGQRVPRVADFQTTTTGTVNSVVLDEVGTSLGVIPRVTPDGLIIMDIEARKSAVGPVDQGIPIGVQDGVAINSPIFDDITAITTISARSGQTVVFSGLISTERSVATRGVPFVSELPVLGQLFRFDTESTERMELMIFMTPHIISSDEDQYYLNQLEAERMSWCMADVIEIHGDPGFGTSNDIWHQQTPVIYPDLTPSAESLPIPGDSGLVPVPERPGEPPYLEAPGDVPPSRPYFDPRNPPMPPAGTSPQGVRIESQRQPDLDAAAGPMPGPVPGTFALPPRTAPAATGVAPAGGLMPIQPRSLPATGPVQPTAHPPAGWGR